VNLSLSLSSITFLKSLFVFSFLLFSFASFSREKTNIETERRFLTSSSLSLIREASLSRALLESALDGEITNALLFCRFLKEEEKEEKEE
tara:strand:+ start:349 stop:618 length:270 start_codon:yes stop_codon:yes gene_type:complete